MTGLARLIVRGRLGQVVALAVTVFFSAVLMGAFGLLLETGARGQVSTGEYRAAPLLVGPEQSVPVDGDVDLAVPGRASLPASVVGDLARASPTSRVVVDRIVPAVLGPGAEPVDAHPWSAFALGNRALSAGRAPAGPDEVVLPGQLAHAHGLKVGDEVRLSLGAAEYTVVGLTTADDAGIDAPDVYLPDTRISTHRRVAAIGVWPKGSADVGTLAHVAARDGARLWDRGDRGRIEVASQGAATGNLVSAAASFGAIALIVAVFTVMALTALQIRERSRELAMLRIVGATPRQVKRLLRAEIRMVAAVAGVLGGIAGPFVGALMIGAIRSWGVLPRSLTPVFGWLPFAVAALTGFAAAELAAAVAVRRVVRDSPLAQLDAGDERSPRTVRRTVVGLAVLAVGILMALAPAYTSNVDAASGLPGLSGLVMALSIGPLSPVVVRAAARLARGTTASAYLALASIRHRAVRVGGALTPIVLGVALGAVQLSGAATSGAVAAAQWDAGHRADLTVTAPTTGVDDRTAELVRDVPGVGTATPFVTAGVIVRGPARGGDGPQTLNALGIAGDAVARYAELKPRDGGRIRLGPGEVALGVLGAAEVGARAGDDITIVLPDGRSIGRHVSALYERGLGFGDVLLPIGDLRPATASGSPTGLAVTVAASTSVPEVRRRIDARLADRPGIGTGASPSAGDDSGAGDRFGLLVLLILFGYIAIAVTNSLIIATLSRRSEFALLAALGATPRQHRGIWRREAVFLATTACVVGTAFALPGLVGMTYALSNGDRVLPAIDPVAYAGIVGFTFVLVLTATALSGRAITREHRT